MYWSTREGGGSGKIQRANLDGTNVEDLVSRVDPTGEIALDLGAGKMYWADFDIVAPDGAGVIRRANLNGTNVEDVIVATLGEFFRGIALDVVGGQIYWTGDLGKIRRAKLDGTDEEELVTGLGVNGVVLGIALDLGAGKMYWAAGKIQRANLDGTDV